ncbi:response regulator [Methylobacterium sp. WL64]|uniref:response regulator n=1 Tax=Methylobacterium sp. WL64 TaxID=2603894 RepID=UPI0011CC08CA|nr:response regulator [Methylobacterium sp. WL64]TXN01295.1 response regulator [Methylobacterium sp. WL64]
MPDTHPLIQRPGLRGARPLAGLPSSPLAYALLALALTAVGWNFVAGDAARRERLHRRELIGHSERLLSTMKDLETGMRGYALTGKPEYLEPYADALGRIPGESAFLDNLDGGSSDPAIAALAPVRKLIGDETVFSDRVVIARRDQGFDSAEALIETGAGKRLMDAIRAATATANRSAAEASAENDRRDSLRYTALTAFSLLCATLAIVLLVRLTIVRRRESQRSSGLFEGVLANAPVGLGFLDGGFNIRHMNRALATMSERGFGADLGAPIWTLLPKLEDQLTPLLEAARDHGLVSADVPVSVPSESAPGGMRHFRMSFYPLCQDEGSAVATGVGLVVADVTTAVLSEAQVRAGEALLRSVLDTLPVGVLIADAPSGRITGHNARAETILGHGVLPAQPGEGPARWVGFHENGRPVEPSEWPLIQVVRAGEPQSELEVDYQRGDGARAWVGFAGAPMRDAEGALIGAVVVVSDIDARKRSEHVLAAAKDAAEEANRAKSEFLANMSHELRTPLSAVIGYSEMLQEEMEDAGQADLLPDMKKIEANARHLLGLINDVLDLSKIEAERMEVYPESIDVAATVRDVAATVEALVEKKGNALVLDIADGLGGAYTDATKLRQCLINLLSNAAKFTEGGEITLSARRQTDAEGDRLVFAVADTGIGMSEEQASRLFKRFSQADASTTRRFGGTGLGLAITRAFAHMLGGDIAVESRQGEGTTFTLTLLASVAEGEERQAQARSPRAPQPSAESIAGSEVLVIDDDQATRDLLARFLAKEGFHVATAADGMAGLEQARTRRPRAILLDVTMPRMDGWAVLRTLRADPELGDLPVIMVTVLDEQNLAFSLGATDYLQKPVDWVQLKEAMERFRPKAHDGPVLVVDDDGDLRALMASQLTRDGWQVVTAADGRAGLAAVGEHRPRLILLDLMMPELDGFGFLRLLRTRPEWYDIPVVVLTAKDVTADDFRQLAGQADRVVQKAGLSFSDLSALLTTLYGADPAEHQHGGLGSDQADGSGMTTSSE